MTTTELLLCAFCGEEFTRSTHGRIGKWCSAKCHSADYRIRERLWKAKYRAKSKSGPDGDGSLPPEQRVNGLEWNGKTQYSEVKPLTFPYARKCSMCGRHPPVEWLTEARARLLGLAGLPPCDVCRGWVFFDLQEVGGMGSPSKAVPARTVAEPVRAVPRRSVA